MIYGLTPVKAAQAILARLSAIEINALLQVGIEVLEKESADRYLIRMGQHAFQARSDRPMEPGRHYWIETSQTKEGIIHLQRMHPKPLLLQKSFPRELATELLRTLSKEDDPVGAWKERIWHHLAASTSKEEFSNLTQLLLSLHQGVVTLPLREDGRQTLLQMRRGGKDGDLNQKSVEFYAGMNNLGPVEGRIETAGEEIRLTLELFYPKSVALLQERREELEGFSRVVIRLKESPVEPFWDMDGPALLDIKG